MLPISAADLFEFRPNRERAARARESLEEAKAEKPRNKVKVDAAQSLLSAAESALERADPVYQLRVPTERSKARVHHDLISEGVALRGNADLVAAILENIEEVTPEDAAFVNEVKARMDGDIMPPEDWPRVHMIARGVPAAARIIAGRLLHANMYRVHSIRHHLVLDGKKSPLSERDFDEFAAANPEDLSAIGDKIAELSILPKASVTAKN